MAYLIRLLDEIGVGGERLRMVNVSSAQGAKFADLCKEATEAVRKLGPNPLKARRPPDGNIAEPGAVDAPRSVQP